MEYNLETEEQSLNVFSLTKGCAVTLTQSYIRLELKGLGKDIVHIYEVSKSTILEHIAWLSLYCWHIFYCHAFTLFASSFLVIKTSFVLLKCCA